MPPPSLSASDVQAFYTLNEETYARLEAYLDLLVRWQRRINLVAASTLTDPWRRHVLDSAQIVPLLPAAPAEVYDLGSGAGFPGLVLSLVGRRPVHLIEADARKCAFLAEATRITGALAVVINRRIETLPPACADVVTARALAPLPQLLPHVARILRESGAAILHKGRAVATELTAAEKQWKMSTTCIVSSSERSGVILKIERLRRV